MSRSFNGSVRQHRWIPAGLALVWCATAVGGDAPESTSAPTVEEVQFTVRVCETEEKLEFWFNDKTLERWDTCETPVVNVPIGLVTASGQKGEAKTGEDGIAELPAVPIEAGEKFRIGIGCTTHQCVSFAELFAPSPFVRPGANRLYIATVKRSEAEGE